MSSQRNRTVLIVGAGPRLARGIARRFGRAGCHVALIGRSTGSVESLATSLRTEGISTIWAQADAADPDDLDAAIRQLVDEAGGVDVAVHNVSVGGDATAAELTAADLLADLAAGTASLLTIARAVSPAMAAAGGGTILATGSQMADIPTPDAPSLGLQKAGLRFLVQAIAPSLADQGVHCAMVTINGIIAEGGPFDPARIAEAYFDVAAETAGPREKWRTVVPYNG